MANVRLTTFHDLTEHLLDYLSCGAGGAAAGGAELRVCKRAVLAAYREVAHSHQWAYYYQRGRLTTSAHYNTGTITFDFTGGASERLVTLASGTWPTWAASGTLLISGVRYEVSSRLSSTTLQLSVNSNPGEDVAAGTEYDLYKDTYTLPGDFITCGEMVNVSNPSSLAYTDPSEWNKKFRIVQGPSTPHYWTITNDPRYFGVLAIRFYPPPDDDYQIDFMYHRRPRDLLVELYDTGTVSTTNGSTTLTGTGTTFTSSMVGCVIRFSTNSTDAPTGPTGDNPATLERVITSYTSATSLTLDSDPGVSLSGVKYTISDPVDLQEGALLTYLLRECERQLRIVKRMEPTAYEEQLYQQAKIAAMEADPRSTELRHQSPPWFYQIPLRDLRSDS